jgi:hypothetical protein
VELLADRDEVVAEVEPPSLLLQLVSTNKPLADTSEAS